MKLILVCLAFLFAALKADAQNLPIEFDVSNPGTRSEPGSLPPQAALTPYGVFYHEADQPTSQSNYVSPGGDFAMSTVVQASNEAWILWDDLSGTCSSAYCFGFVGRDEGTVGIPPFGLRRIFYDVPDLAQTHVLWFDLWPDSARWNVGQVLVYNQGEPSCGGILQASDGGHVLPACNFANATNRWVLELDDLRYAGITDQPVFQINSIALWRIWATQN